MRFAKPVRLMENLAIFFEPLTLPFDPSNPEGSWETIAQERMNTLQYYVEGRKEDIWGFHRFLLERIQAENNPEKICTRWWLFKRRAIGQ